MGIEPKIALDAIIVRKSQKTEIEEPGKYCSERKEPEDIEESENVTIGNVDSDEIDEGMSNLIRRAQQKGLPSVWTKKLDSLVR